MSADKPKPMIFAIMRNGHEVIRGGQKDVSAAITAGEIEDAKKKWDDLHKWTTIHMTMEEGNGKPDAPSGFFKILDEHCDNVVTENKLYDAHEELTKVENSLNEAFDSKDLDTAKTKFEEFSVLNEEHLKKEEDIMMPNVKKMMMAGHPMKKFMKDDILPLVGDDMEFFVKYSSDVLDRHAEGQPRARVFNHALWAVATEDQWKEWNEWIKESQSPECYAQLESCLA